ncbi:hypothetical protein J3459_016075 [Metarhizium acridum]|nr:hypothetical protein J3459_016075 [Metarhizium acridum]
MFGIGAMALYSGHHDAVPTQAPERNPKIPNMPRPFTSSSHLNTPFYSSSMEQLSSASVADFLGPAVDSPPSPQKLRQLNKQMKRASHLQRHHGHRTASSESSSLSSMHTSERLPWELSRDNLSLVRKSSIRSNDSSAPSRDGPESIHNFGKSFFRRRGKSKRESSTRNSSASSIYSGDMPTENIGHGGREGFIPSIFSRRKPSRDETAQRRPYISGPFNFQHVAHTQRDNVVNNELHVNVPETLNDAFTGGFETSSYPRNMSSESIGDVHQEQTSGAVSRPPLVPRHTAPASGPRRLLQHIRSQEQLRNIPSQPPPRPPRSPIQANGFCTLGPLPPRGSSRQSNYQDITDVINMNAAARAQTSNEVCQPFPFGYATSPEHMIDDLNSQEHSYSRTQERFPPDEKRYSRVMPGARDSTWPLAISTPVSYETLPDVPEEEEQHGMSRRSRLSLASTNSSLRGSQSVPMLRSFTESRRPTSVVSETLGGLGITGLNHIVDDDHRSLVQPITPTRESWEDLIDYCYEHEAEANCDYQWERPSLDTARDSLTPPAKLAALDDNGIEPASNRVLSANSHDSLSVVGQEAPSLSPASHISTPVEHEVVTPNSAVTNNFSLPRGDKKSIRPLNMKESRHISGLSTFGESQAFTLSPSFLIPVDYQQPMLLSHDTEKQAYSDFDLVGGHFDQSALHEDTNSSAEANGSSPLLDQRSSTSTTETNSTSRSNSIGRQYRSTNSSWTTLARRTASSTSLNRMAGSLTDDSEPLPKAQTPDHDQDGPEWAGTYPAAQDHVPDMIPFPPSNGLKKYYHKSHASESQVRDDAPPPSLEESVKPRRPRAKTTSLTVQSPPPVGQYALFPRTHMKATGAHI